MDESILSILVNTKSDKGKSYVEKNNLDLIRIDLKKLGNQSMISYVYENVIGKYNLNNWVIYLMILISRFEYIILLYVATLALFVDTPFAVKIIIIAALITAFPYLLLYKEKGSYNHFDIYASAFKMRLSQNESLALENAHLITSEQIRELNSFIENIKGSDINILVAGDLEIYKHNVQLAYPQVDKKDDVQNILDEYYSLIIE